MLAENAIPPAVVNEESHQLKFFRQSGWMMIATVVSGIFAFFVHPLARWVPETEYSAAATMIAVVNWMSIPALGLQMVFAHQTSAAVTMEQRQQLVRTFKTVLRWTFYVWLLMALVVAVENHQIQAALKLSNPWTLWFALVSGLMMLWTPILNGLLQGRQNFLWMGWVAIISGFGRVAIAAVIVIIFHGWAAGIVLGITLGLMASVAVAFWQNRDLWNEPGAPFDAMGWLKHVLPLTITCGVGQFLLSADPIIAQNYLGKDGAAAPYLFGGTLARAIVLTTAPLAAVMFPKLVHRKARSETGGPNLLGLTLLGSGILGCLAAAGLAITARWLIPLGKPEFAGTYIIALVPLFAGAMVPLSLGNVLLNNLNAHSYFKPVPVLVVLAIGYWIALLNFHDSFKMVIETLGVFNLLFLGVCLFFTWRLRLKERSEAVKGGASGG